MISSGSEWMANRFWISDSASSDSKSQILKSDEQIIIPSPRFTDDSPLPASCPKVEPPPKCPEPVPIIPEKSSAEGEISSSSFVEEKLAETQSLHIPITPSETPCPSGNNIDVQALKNELTEHFTGLIQEQCKCNCDCPPGPVIIPPVANGGGGDPDELDRKIHMAIKKYDADKTGLPDVALEPGGGSIVSTRCTKSAQHKNSIVSLFGIPIWSPPNNPRMIIQVSESLQFIEK